MLRNFEDKRLVVMLKVTGNKHEEHDAAVVLTNDTDFMQTVKMLKKKSGNSR